MVLSNAWAIASPIQSPIGARLISPPKTLKDMLKVLRNADACILDIDIEIVASLLDWISTVPPSGCSEVRFQSLENSRLRWVGSPRRYRSPVEATFRLIFSWARVRSAELSCPGASLNGLRFALELSLRARSSRSSVSCVIWQRWQSLGTFLHRAAFLYFKATATLLLIAIRGPQFMGGISSKLFQPLKTLLNWLHCLTDQHPASTL